MTGSAAPLHVVAAVLRDDAGRILLAERPGTRDHGGLWEFPGGKREPGESIEQALRRELSEELGITIGPIRPLIAVPHAGRRRLLLDVHEVERFDGAPAGLEGQALRWVEPAALGDWPMPPADRPVVAALTAPALYAISPEPGEDRPTFLAAVERVLAAGVRRLQLRAKQIDDASLRPLAAAVAARCASAGASLLLNGRIALAAELGCGLHLTEAQLRGLAARPLPPARPVAASCHDLAGLRHAEALGLDWAVLGPVLPTRTHPEASPLGWDGFAALREQVGLPIYALGGLAAADLAIARRHGAQGIAAIRGLWPAAAPAPIGTG